MWDQGSSSARLWNRRKQLTLGDLPVNTEERGYIYQLTFPDAMQYVGQAVNVARRMQSHRNGNKRGQGAGMEAHVWLGQCACPGAREAATQPDERA